MFSNQPVYFASFEVELLAFRCHVVLPGLTSYQGEVRRYLTVSAWRTAVWLMYTGGQCPRRRVNVMCEDLVSVFILQFRVQVSIERR
jgi:hypothetical protein